MNFSVLPPEITSAQIHSGPGSAPMLAAAAAWSGLRSELGSAASSFSSVISGLTDAPWQGPASAAMAAVATRYSQWLRAAEDQAGGTANQAEAVASSYEAARAAITHPLAVAANRMRTRLLAMSNFFGFNAPAIAAAEAEYEGMWAQNIGVMAGYHTAASAVAANLSSWQQTLQTLPGQAASAMAAAATPAAATAGTGIPAQLRATNQAYLAHMQATNQAQLARGRQVASRDFSAAASALRSGDVAKAATYGTAGALYQAGAHMVVATNNAAAVPSLIGLDATTTGHLLGPAPAVQPITAAANSGLFGQIGSTNQSFVSQLDLSSRTQLNHQGAIAMSDFRAAGSALGAGDVTGAATYAVAGGLVGTGAVWSVGTGLAFAPPRLVGLDLLTAGAYLSPPVDVSPPPGGLTS